MLSASVISAAIAGRLSGPGTNMGQNLHFKAPIRAGDTVHATVTVKELIPEKCRARLTTVCTVDGEIVIDGGCIGNDHVARSPKNLVYGQIAPRSACWTLGRRSHCEAAVAIEMGG
jgi:hypothetical protein